MEYLNQGRAHHEGAVADFATAASELRHAVETEEKRATKHDDKDAEANVIEKHSACFFCQCLASCSRTTFLQVGHQPALEVVGEASMHEREACQRYRVELNGAASSIQHAHDTAGTLNQHDNPSYDDKASQRRVENGLEELFATLTSLAAAFAWRAEDLADALAAINHGRLKATLLGLGLELR